MRDGFGDAASSTGGGADGREIPDGEEPGTSRWTGGDAGPLGVVPAIDPGAAPAPVPGVETEVRTAGEVGEWACCGAGACEEPGMAGRGTGMAGRDGSPPPRTGVAILAGEAAGVGVADSTKFAVEGVGAGTELEPRASLPADGWFTKDLIRSTMEGSRLAKALSLTSRPSF